MESIKEESKEVLIQDNHNDVCSVDTTIANDFFYLISDSDEAGVPLDWYPVRADVVKNGVGAIESIFDYYQEHTQFDPWVNYQLACSYFTDEELGLTGNRAFRRALEGKVKRMMVMKKKNPNMSDWSIIRNSANV